MGYIIEMCEMKRRTMSVSSTISRDMQDDVSVISSSTRDESTRTAASPISEEWLKVSGKDLLLEPYHVITGLKERYQYLFRVAAVNKAGTGLFAMLRLVFKY